MNVHEQRKIERLKELYLSISTYKINEAPKKTEWGKGMNEIIIPIGKDNVMNLYFHDDDMKALEAIISSNGGLFSKKKVG